MKKLLLTGFEPFLDFAINPTKEIVESLQGNVINGYGIVGRILTVDFSKSGKQLIEAIEEVEPDAVISLGLAAGRHKITPERIAINCNDGTEPDNNGIVPQGERIIEDGPDGLFSTLPIQQMVTKLDKSGFPAAISNSAGTYLCNNVMYHSLYHFYKKEQNVPAGFIHLPASHQLAVRNKRIPSWSQQDLNESIKICLECLRVEQKTG